MFSFRSINIIKQDFFDYKYIDEYKNILVIGNPPFGQQNNLAIKFINHAATFSNTIAFILPKSFKKESVKTKINKYFHLRTELELPKNSFILNNQKMDVPCVFQIWDKKDFERENKEINDIKGFTFVKKENNPNLYIQRVGGNAGKAGIDYQDRSFQSNYFIQNNTKINDIKLIDVINSINFNDRDNTVGPRSISKKELLKELNNTGLFE